MYRAKEKIFFFFYEIMLFNFYNLINTFIYNLEINLFIIFFIKYK